jgi:hypothetical protein
VHSLGQWLTPVRRTGRARLVRTGLSQYNWLKPVAVRSLDRYPEEITVANTISDGQWASLQDRAGRANPMRAHVGHPEQVRAAKQGAQMLEAARRGQQ